PERIFPDAEASFPDAVNWGWGPNSPRDGAGDRVRTGDVQLGRLTLYQLSYARVSVQRGFDRAHEWRVMDSNHRRLCRQIYSLLPLAARATLQNPFESNHIPFRFSPRTISSNPSVPISFARLFAVARSPIAQS